MTTPAKRLRQKENRQKYGKGHVHPRDRRCLTCKPLPKTALAGALPEPKAAPAFRPSSTPQQIGYATAQVAQMQRETDRQNTRRGLLRRGRR